MLASLFDSKGRRRFTVPVIAAAQSSFLWYIELTGAYEAQRALYANLVSNLNPRQDTVPTLVRLHGDGIDQIVIIDGTSPFQWSWQADRVIGFHPWFNRLNYKLLFGGDKETAPVYFTQALNNVDVPYRPEWAPQIWPAAVRTGCVLEPAIMYGAQFWQVSPFPDGWRKVVKSLLKSGAVH